MRGRVWLALLGYGLVMGTGVALALRPGSGPAVAAIAPLHPGTGTTLPPAGGTPPVWALIHLGRGRGGATPRGTGAVPWRAARLLGGLLLEVLGGYAGTGNGALAAALPGLPPTPAPPAAAPPPARPPAGAVAE